jgi:CRISPR-associated protein (TIGR03986 family)
MAKGVIKKWFGDRGYGFISQVNRGGDVYFNTYSLEGVSIDGLQEGLEVTYDLEEGPRGLKASNLHIKEARESPPSADMQSDSNDYHFLNPYNFVRYLGSPSLTDIHVLGRCPPPPHDRYVGLTGRISCELEAVTPLFISDSHAISIHKVDNKDHPTYRFFQLDGQPAIPATSLRGMIRSVFEGETNSCYMVFDGDKRLFYRDINIAQKMNPGIVKSLAEDGKDGKIALCKEAVVGAYPGCKWPIVLNASWRTGEKAFAAIQDGKRLSYVTNLSRSSTASSSIKGWLKITGQNIDKKLSERFFYRPKSNSGLWVDFSIERQKDYNEVLNQQRKEKGFSSIHQHDKLTPGDLVYVELEKGLVRNISATKVPRLRYRSTIGDRLEIKDLYHCSSIESLCPSCRVFGWTYSAKKGEKPPLEKPTAYASRVQISNAMPKEGCNPELFLEDFTLAILQSPKPTTTAFYLLNSEGFPDDVDYDSSNAQLRGRKIYRHHGIWSEWTRSQKEEFKRSGGKQDDQNRTVKGVIKPGAKFCFTLEFKNLSKIEIGALLWSLVLEKDMFHRLGFAKPLGFGSVKVRIVRLDIMDVRNRYASFQPKENGWKKVEGYQKWIDDFKSSITDFYDCPSFDRLSNIQDLHYLLCVPDVKYIHYPRSENPPTEEGENFKWFVGNKRRLMDARKPKHKRKLPDPQLLPLPGDDNGFTLMDERGFAR